MAEKITVTDYDMCILSQISYIRGAKSNETLGRFINEYRNSINRSDESNLLRTMYRNSKKSGSIDNRKYLDYKTLLTKTNLSKYDNWVISNIMGSDYPDNGKSGIYAYTVKAGENNVVVFRGSENPEQNINDWQSDVDLIDSLETPQQKDAGVYMSKLAKDPEISGSIYITGHSLGGNLAMYAAITSPDTIKTRLQKCDSFNGPGFCVGFILKNSSNIKKVKSKIFAFQNENDFVSSILNCPAEPIIIKSTLENKLDAYNHAAAAYTIDGTEFVRAGSKFFVENGVHDLSIIIQFVPRKILDKIKPQILSFMRSPSKLTPVQKTALFEFFLPVFIENPANDFRTAGMIAGSFGDLLFFEYAKQKAAECIKNLRGDFNNLCSYLKLGNEEDNILSLVSENILISAMNNIKNG